MRSRCLICIRQDALNILALPSTLSLPGDSKHTQEGGLHRSMRISTNMKEWLTVATKRYA